jgi:small-conductance mechanosensitive channel
VASLAYTTQATSTADNFRANRAMEDNLKLELETVQKIFDLVAEFLVNYSFQVLGAIIILILGWLLARWVSGFVDWPVLSS